MEWALTLPQGDLHSVHLGDLAAEEGGQVLECSLCMKQLEPDRRAAAAVWADQLGPDGARQPCGLRVYAIPAHHQPGPADVILTGVRFILPGRPQAGPRRLVVRADVHYVDRQQTCLLAPRPSQEEAQADRPL